MNKYLLATAAAVIAATIPAAASAQRINPTAVAVVDTQRVLNDCNACRTARQQLQTQIQQAQQRAQQLQAPLQTEGTAIQQAVTALGTKQPDAALQKRIEAFRQQQATAERELTGREQTLQSINAHINQQVGARVGPIINSVMANRGANLVVPKEMALASTPAVDLTEDVLAQLNQQLTTISVTPLPQPQQPAAAGQQQQQQPQGR